MNEQQAQGSSTNDKIVITLELPRELARQVDEVAKANDRSRSAELRIAARRHVEATQDERSTE